jgi:hypothetical protein
VWIERLRFGVRAPEEIRPAPSGVPGF